MNESVKNKKIKIIILAISILVPVLVAFLNWGLSNKGNSVSFDLTIFPKINASINFLVSILLILGLYFIKNKKDKEHKIVMGSAFSLSILFLFSYVFYHSLAKPASFGGSELIKYFYFTILISHIILAAVVMPFILYTFYFALTNQLKDHRKIAKYTWFVWFYVSITGVIVYLMISPYY